MVSIRFYLSLLSICMVLFASCNPPPQSAFQKSWSSYVERFYQSGRIVDTGNKNISHSEGQGYGMLFAVEADDQERFDEMWDWTKRVLMRPDNLFSWQYTPCDANNRTCITDKNNASDGEILLAWALLRATKKWQEKKYQKAANKILMAFQEKLVIERFDTALIIPGEYGFNKDSTTQINLSYWVFPALKAFDAYFKNPLWNKLIESGLTLMETTRFGSTQLNPDWTILSDSSPSIQGAISPDYGFNACRIPLHLVWMGTTDTKLLAPYLTFWSQSFVPATVNLLNDNPAEYSYTVGMQSIHDVTMALATNKTEFLAPIVDSKSDYFSASLIMLSHLAWLDNQQ
ncbi:glycosyl hydrolase family 8 [Paraglaciecola sp.]|uniref:glycosyl hydrolase family 8 n=1 Tax=Paraglaciecola sp. TaxID=1920173 RepID=UPI003265CD3C